MPQPRARDILERDSAAFYQTILPRSAWTLFFLAHCASSRTSLRARRFIFARARTGRGQGRAHRRETAGGRRAHRRWLLLQAVMGSDRLEIFPLGSLYVYNPATFFGIPQVGR